MPRITGLLASILRRPNRDLANRIADEVVQKCNETPLEGSSRDLHGRSIGFLRGYVRATLAGVIDFETGNALQRHGASADLHPLVADLATQRLVDSTLDRILESQAESTARRMAA